MIRDRFVEKADLCLNLYPCVLNYDFLLSLFLSLSLFSPSPSLFPSLSLSPSFPLSQSLPLSLTLSPLPIPSPFLSSCPSVLRRGICGCFLRRKGMWTDKWSLLLKLHCLITSLHFYTCCCTAPARPLASDLFISSMEPESMRLSWRPAALPARATTPSYLIEALEYPSTQWRPLASDVRDTSYQLTGLAPTKDYSFRVRATTPAGGLTEPTTPVTITSLPGK